MKILITGGSGFIGDLLCPTLIQQGHSLILLTRRPELVSKKYPQNVEVISRLQAIAPSTKIDAVINLSGEGIADKRWSDARKKALRDSRIGVTEELVQVMAGLTQTPKVLISGSAIGVYGDQGDLVLNEQITEKDESDFARTLCQDWEAAALEAEKHGTRVCLLRTGLVVGRNGGFLKRMLLPFRFGLGGQLADGKQWMSWIHRHDHVRMMLFLLERDDLRGIFNATAPNPVTNKTFTQTLAGCFNKKPFLPVPGFALKLGMGEMASLLSGGQRVIPQKFLDAGFTFSYPNLDDALNDVLQKKAE